MIMLYGAFVGLYETNTFTVEIKALQVTVWELQAKNQFFHYFNLDEIYKVENALRQEVEILCVQF